MGSFHAESKPSNDQFDWLAAHYPDNPFYTAAFANARAAGGAETWILSLRNDAGSMGGCTAFMRGGQMRRTLSIVSAPALSEDDCFWHGLLRFCRARRVMTLDVNTFASKPSRLPSLGTERWRKCRTEYVLDLQASAPEALLSTNTKRNIKRAEKAGVTVCRAHDPDACKSHVQMIDASTSRRRDRGETLSGDITADRFAAYLEHGAGEIFQAVLDGKILSSILVLKSATAGYYHSAGTNPSGMSVGASAFLLYGVAKTLRDQGHRQFNLGGTDSEQTGLIRFKLGFGATCVSLEAASFEVGNRPVQRLFKSATPAIDRIKQFLGNVKT